MGLWKPASGTVSLFSIDPKDPTEIELIGQPTSTVGEFPISVAFNAKGTQACVLNAGGPINGVKYALSFHYTDTTLNTYHR